VGGYTEGSDSDAPIRIIDALAAVARVVAEAPTLGDAVSRLSAVLREVIPFDRLHCSASIAQNRSRCMSPSDRASSLSALTGCPTPARFPAPRPGCAFAPDLSRSAWPRVHGALWVTAVAEGVFTAEHQELLDGVADLVALAVGQEAMRTTEQVRRERIDSLDRLLHTVANHSTSGASSRHL